MACNGYIFYLGNWVDPSIELPKIQFPFSSASLEYHNNKMAMRRFGFIKHLPKPKTEKDWDRVWRQNKIELPSVEKIVLTLSDKGAGQTGARYVFTIN